MSATANKEVLEDIGKLSRNFEKMQSDLLTTKTVSSELLSRPGNMERQCWANAQYSRRECLELVGIPKEVKQKDLEGKVLPSLKGFVLKSTQITSRIVTDPVRRL